MSRRKSRRPAGETRFAIATATERLLKIAIDGTVQAPSVIDDAAYVA
jgi:hypothetical protein